MPVKFRTEQKINIDRIFDFKKNKNSWRDYIIPVKNKEESISENIDKVLY